MFLPPPVGQGQPTHNELLLTRAPNYLLKVVVAPVVVLLRHTAWELLMLGDTCICELAHGFECLAKWKQEDGGTCASCLLFSPHSHISEYPAWRKITACNRVVSIFIGGGIFTEFVKTINLKTASNNSLY